MMRNHACSVSERLILYYVHVQPCKNIFVAKRQGPELQTTEIIRVVEKGGYPRAWT